ncbi:hypothetical protein Q0M94_14350 [Deinococcus radiomollis]|uniref:hypothetical protein n=1 Tax=Deinococcus radiomollis TaxID=468916 RepID=UPI0038911ACE
MDVADPDRLPPITRGKLQLDDPVCRAWVNSIMSQLARTMPPERAMAWWMRLHIGLRNKAPMYILPEGWTPACAEACLLEAYACQAGHLAQSETLPEP